MTILPAGQQLADIAFSESIPPFAKIMGIAVFAVLSSRFLLHKRRVDTRGVMQPHVGYPEGVLQKPPGSPVARKDLGESLPSDSREKSD